MSSNEQQIILVTGANKGIGYEAVKILSQKLPQSTILLGTRTFSNGEAAIAKLKESDSTNKYNNVKILLVDVTSKSSLTEAVSTVKQDYGRLDVLLHNSGISHVDGDQLHRDVIDVNTVGSYNVMQAFLPLLPKQGKVIVVSSEVGTWSMEKYKPDLQTRLDTPKKNMWPEIESLIEDWVSFSKNGAHKEQWAPLKTFTGGAYTNSKAFLTAYVRGFAVEHPDLQVAIVCPGYCATDLNNNQGYRPASKGGESVTWPVFNKFTSGDFYQDGEKHATVQPIPAEFAKYEL